jgi:DNA transformation protein
MNVSDGFRDFVIDQLSDIPQLQSRKMFGGYGLYSGGKFFAILSSDRIYMKTTDTTRDRFVAAGSEFFQPNAKQALKNYYELPAEVLENREEFSNWAMDIIEALSAEN